MTLPKCFGMFWEAIASNPDCNEKCGAKGECLAKFATGVLAQHQRELGDAATPETLASKTGVKAEAILLAINYQQSITKAEAPQRAPVQESLLPAEPAPAPAPASAGVDPDEVPPSPWDPETEAGTLPSAVPEDLDVPAPPPLPGQAPTPPPAPAPVDAPTTASVPIVEEPVAPVAPPAAVAAQATATAPTPAAQAAAQAAATPAPVTGAQQAAATSAPAVPGKKPPRKKAASTMKAAPKKKATPAKKPAANQGKQSTKKPPAKATGKAAPRKGKGRKKAPPKDKGAPVNPQKAGAASRAAAPARRRTGKTASRAVAPAGSRKWDPRYNLARFKRERKRSPLIRKLREGYVLNREFPMKSGNKHRVVVCKDHYRYKGRKYPTLYSVVKEIMGTKPHKKQVRPDGSRPRGTREMTTWSAAKFFSLAKMMLTLKEERQGKGREQSRKRKRRKRK